MNKYPLIFFVYPGPKGSEENQFTPLGDGVNKLIFERQYNSYSGLPMVIVKNQNMTKIWTLYVPILGKYI
jgi:hypothetical protein